MTREPVTLPSTPTRPARVVARQRFVFFSLAGPQARSGSTSLASRAALTPSTGIYVEILPRRRFPLVFNLSPQLAFLSCTPNHLPIALPNWLLPLLCAYSLQHPSSPSREYRGIASQARFFPGPVRIIALYCTVSISSLSTALLGCCAVGHPQPDARCRARRGPNIAVPCQLEPL